MHNVCNAFKQFTKITHFSTQRIVPMRSLFPYIQVCCTPNGVEHPPDLPVWPSAVSLVCSMGTQKDERLTLLDAAVALIAINNISTILDIFDNCDESQVDELSFEILKKVVESHRDLLKVLVPILKPKEESVSEEQNNKKESSSTCEKLIKRLKVIEKEPFNKIKISAAQKECSKLTKNIFKSFYSCFTHGAASELIRYIHKVILNFQSLGVFLNLTGQGEQFAENESVLNDLVECIFTNNLQEINFCFDDLNSTIKDFEESLDLSAPLRGCIHVVYKRMRDSINELENETKKTDAQKLVASFVIPERANPFPVEFSSYILAALSSLSATTDPKLLDQVTLYIYQKSNDRQIQYLCSSIKYVPEKAPGTLAILATLIPFTNELMKEHLLNFLSVASSLFIVFHAKCAEVVSQSLSSIPTAMEDAINKALLKPNTLRDFHKCILAFRAFERMAGNVPNRDVLELNCEILENIAAAIVMAHASCLRLCASELVQFAIGFSEKCINISKKTLGIILDNFRALQKVSYDSEDLSEYNGMMDTVVTLTDRVAHVVKQIIANSSVSLIEADSDIAKLSAMVKDTYEQFDALEDNLKPIQGLPNIAAKECTKSCIDPLISCSNFFLQSLQTQPEYSMHIKSDLRILMFKLHKMIVMVDLEETAEDIDKISQLYRKIDASTNAEELIPFINDFIIMLTKFGQKLYSQNVDRDLIEGIDLSDIDVLYDACQRISNETLRNATILFIQQSTTTPTVQRLFELYPDLVRSLLIARMKGVEMPDIDEVMQYSDDQLTNSKFLIASALPLLSSPSNCLRLNVHIAQLLMTSSVQEARIKMNEIYPLIMQVTPLHDGVVKIVYDLVNTDRNVLGDIKELADKYGAAMYEVEADDDRKKAILQLSYLYSRLYQMTRRFSKELIEQQIDVINSNGNVEAAVNIILSSFMTAALSNGSFTPENLFKVFQVNSDLNAFLQTGMTTEKKKLIDSIRLLPTTFKQEGKLTTDFASAFALILSQDEESEEDYTDFLKLLGLEGQVIETFFKTLYETSPEEVNDPALEQERLYESLANIKRSLKKLLKAVKSKDPESVAAKYQKFLAEIEEMKRFVAITKDEKLANLMQDNEELLKLIGEIIAQLSKGDLTNLSQLIDAINSVLNSISQLDGSKLRSPISDILAVLSEDVHEITSTIDFDPSDQELSSYEPLRKVIINESRSIFSFTRICINESRKYIESIANESVLNDEDVTKSIIYAVNQVREAIQILYLIVRMADNDDKRLKSKAINGCRRFSATIQLFISHVLLPDGDQYVESRIKDTMESISKHTSSIIDFATQYGSITKKNVEETIEISTELSLERLKLTARIGQLRRAYYVEQNNLKILSE